MSYSLWDRARLQGYRRVALSQSHLYMSFRKRRIMARGYYRISWYAGLAVRDKSVNIQSNVINDRKQACLYDHLQPSLTTRTVSPPWRTLTRLHTRSLSIDTGDHRSSPDWMPKWVAMVPITLSMTLCGRLWRFVGLRRYCVVWVYAAVSPSLHLGVVLKKFLQFGRSFSESFALFSSPDTPWLGLNILSIPYLLVRWYMILLDKSLWPMLAYTFREFEMWEPKSPQQRSIANCQETHTGPIARR